MGICGDSHRDYFREIRGEEKQELVMPKGNRKKYEKAKEQIDAVMNKKRVGRPLTRSKFPEYVEAIDKVQKDRAGEAYMRLAAMARDTKLRKSRPSLYVDIQKWLWEVAYPKKTIFDGETGLPIHVTFEVVGSPKEIEDPKVISEAKVIEIEAPNYESLRTEKTDITNTVTVD